MRLPLPPARFRGYVALGLAVLLNLTFSLVGWDHSPREVHDSRQVQTALSIKYLARDGLALAYPLPLFGPPWSAPFEFPLYQGTAAVIARATGLGPESAGRLAALLFLYLAIPAAYLAQELLAVPQERRWLFPVLLLLSPAQIYYSRSFMIESAAMCAGAWFLLAFGRAFTRPGWAWPAAALALGALAALAKLTTAVVFLAPAGLFALRCLLRPGAAPASARGRGTATALTVLIFGGVLAAGLLWTRHADAIKSSNPLSAAFVSAELRDFVFGPISQRFDPGFWLSVGQHSAKAVMPAANGVLLAVFGLMLAHRGRAKIAALLGCFLAGPLIFANLHAVHDYYFYACGVFALLALALAWSELLDQTTFPFSARAGVIAVSLAIQLAGYLNAYFPAQWRPTSRSPELAPILRAVTQPDDILLILGQDWNPAVPYFADRRAIMVVDRLVPETELLAGVIDRAEPGQVTALLVSSHFRLYPAMFRSLQAKLDLARDPVLSGADTDVYVAQHLVEPVREFFRKDPVPNFTLTEEAAENITVPRTRVAVSDLPDASIVSMLSPALVEVVHPFTPAAHRVGDQLVADAHAPTDFIFEVPAGMTQVEIEFGMLGGAYTSDQPTDGMEFRLELGGTAGARRTLFSRELRPVSQPRDRGTQRALVSLPVDASGRLVCRTLPGPSGSIASDWGYWSRIEFK